MSGKLKIVLAIVATAVLTTAIFSTLAFRDRTINNESETSVNVSSFYHGDLSDGVWAYTDYQAFIWSPMTPTSYISNTWEPTGELLPSSFLPDAEVIRVLVPVRANLRNARIVPNAVPNGEEMFCGASAFWQGFAFGENAIEAEATGLAYSSVDIYAGIDLVWLVVDLHAGDRNTCDVTAMLNRLRPVINIQDQSDLTLDGWIFNSEEEANS